MGTNSTAPAQDLAGNGTGGEDLGHQELSRGLLALKVMNITAVSLAIAILMVAIVLCGRTWHRRSRQYWRAREYEDGVKHNTVIGSGMDITNVRRIIGLHKSLTLMRTQESLRHDSQVYFIYSNPAMAAEEEGEEEVPATPSAGRSLCISRSIPSDIKSSGIILDPRVFYI